MEKNKHSLEIKETTEVKTADLEREKEKGRNYIFLERGGERGREREREREREKEIDDKNKTKNKTKTDLPQLFMRLINGFLQQSTHIFNHFNFLVKKGTTTNSITSRENTKLAEPRIASLCGFIGEPRSRTRWTQRVARL